MSVKSLKILTFILVVLCSCNKTAKPVASKEKSFGGPCNVKFEISGKASCVQFVLFSKAKDKSISIDKQVDVLDDIKDEVSISSYLGGKIKCSLKTKDSFGPNVKIKVFVNGKFWQEVEDSYNPIIEGEIPLNF
tara:strand:- start:708 stop:1109 length:402 start_codon:yes stop_codon:yes gene_type:complete